MVLGTAGHVDHGKTALVGALTGTNTDRLAEERRRGVSIELGYACLTLPSGRRLSVVDVPGHESFVRTMVAGASGIDMFLLCVAADDGVMPQTREHLAVLRAFDVTRGVVAITRSDLADPGPAQAAIGELLAGYITIPVSAPTGAGVDQLTAALDRIAVHAPVREHDAGPVVLHVDRSFTLTGHGTIITGTLWSGSVSVGDRLVALPLDREIRIRSLQVHDTAVETAAAGQRVALGVAGASWREIARGDVVCARAAAIEPAYALDARLRLEADARPLARGERLKVHHGTRDVIARVVPLEGDTMDPGTGSLCQLRCEQPLLAADGDRLVLRQLTPPDTIGGGIVIDPRARRHGGSPTIVARLRRLERGEQPSSDPPAQPLVDCPGAVPALDDVARQVAELLRVDGASPRSDMDLAAAVGVEPRTLAPRLLALERDGAIVRVGRNLHFHPGPLAELGERTLAICRRDGATTVAALRDELATSRRYAQALLEYLDSCGVTIRRGDEHVLRRRPRSDDGVEPSKRRAAPP